MLCALVLPCTTAMAAEPISLAPYQNDMEAAAAGQQLGIGRAVLEGPKSAEVMSHQTWTLVYTVGEAGIQPGGGLRIGMRHLVQWSSPQIDKPEAEGYLTARSDPGVPLKVYIEFGTFKRFFQRYHPWQNMVEVTLPEKGLEEGDKIRITFGDRTGGSPGMRVQPFDESPFVFKVYVDPRGEDDYFPLMENPSVEIVAAAAYRLGIVMPSDAVVGEPVWCIVRAEDRYGNPATSYRGEVEIALTDTKAPELLPYRFTELDRGVHRFEAIIFRTPGDHTLTVSDGKRERRSNPVRVAEKAPERLLLWGDLHGHTLHSDGRGTVEQFYDFAERVAGLDFCAVTDHAFEVIDPMWEHSKRVTNRVNRPGRFVTFQAYEWSGQQDVGGDHNVYFLADDPPIIRSRSYYNYRNFQMYHGPTPQVNHVQDLFATLAPMLADRDVFTIPHWGGRHGNPAWHEPRVQRMIEVFSEHRRSEDWMTPFLKNRYRLGIIASTDGHFGNPGYGYLKPTYDWDTQEIGMAAVAVYAEDRTRESIFHALYDRHVYATSGDRIILDFRADGHPMGSEYTTRDAPTLIVHVAGTAPIQRIEIKKDSEIVHTVEPANERADVEWRDPDFRAGRECYYYVRVLQSNNEEAISSPIWVN
jgi:hypothetical protein